MTSMRTTTHDDWDKELKKIDKQLESMSDEALVPARRQDGAAPAREGAGRRGSGATTTLGRVCRGSRSPYGARRRHVFWPYPTRCGLGLAGYLAAVGVVVAGGRVEHRVDVAASRGARARPVAAARAVGPACSARSRSCRASATRSPTRRVRPGGRAASCRSVTPRRRSTRSRHRAALSVYEPRPRSLDRSHDARLASAR